MSNKTLPVIKREFLMKVKTKSFIITTILLPVFMIFVMGASIFLGTIDSQKKRRFMVVDFSGRIFEPLTKILSDKSKEGDLLYSLTKKEITMEHLEETKSELSIYVLDKKITGYMIIPDDILETEIHLQQKGIQFYTKNVSDFVLIQRLRDAVSRVVRSLRLRDSGLDPIIISQLARGVDLVPFKVTAEGKEQKDVGFTLGLTYILVMILYMALILYGTMIARSVVEEKSSRVIEMIVSSVKPFQLMSGKILGIGGAGLLQALIWLGFLLGISACRHQIGDMFDVSSTILSSLPEIQPEMLVFFIVFFILGFLFYATMYAAVGAIACSDQEAQQAQTPLVMFLIVPILAMTYIIRNPDSSAAFILSIIPFFSPLIMFMRISILKPPIWEIALSILILIPSILVMIWLTAKIYRVGILMYGKRPSLREITKWVRYS